MITSVLGVVCSFQTSYPVGSKRKNCGVSTEDVDLPTHMYERFINKF